MNRFEVIFGFGLLFHTFFTDGFDLLKSLNKISRDVMNL
jgi:hypothetical protein